MKQMIDVHCYIQDGEFDGDRDKVIERAKAAGVEKIITSTLNLGDAQKVGNRYICSLQNKGVIYVTIGCDPCLFDENEIEKIQQFIRDNSNRIVGIGEVGLDYYRIDESQREKQKEIFISFIKLAKEVKLPLVIHSRSAGKYAIEVLLEQGGGNSGGCGKVLMHAYDGKVGYALQALNHKGSGLTLNHEGSGLNFYFSIPTSIVHSEQKQKLVKALPIERLMLESDSPVLGPVRGERNEPANLVLSVKAIAEIKNISEETVADVTTRNAINFFKLM